MIKRKLALLGTAVAVSLLMTVPAFAADTKDTDTAQNAQNIQSVQEEKTEENTGYVTCSVLNVRRARSEKSDKVGTLKRGEEVKILRDEENGCMQLILKVTSDMFTVIISQQIRTR